MTRTFISALGLLAALTGAVWASPAPQAAKPPIPPDLFYEFKTIPDEENAISDWHRAGELMVAGTAKDRLSIKYCWTPGAPEPAAEDLAKLQNWRKQNVEASQRLADSLKKPKASWPKHEPQKSPPELRAISPLISLRLFDADQLAQAGQFEPAARVLEDSVKITQLGVDAEGAPLIDYLIAGLARENIQGAIVRLGERKQVPLGVLRRLLEDLPSLDTETNVFARVLSTDFTLEYQNSWDPESLAKSWSSTIASNMARVSYPPELQRPFEVLLDPALVSQHPDPLDKVAELEKDATEFRIFRTNSFSAWTNHSWQVITDRQAARGKLLEDIEPLMKLVKDEPLPLSRQAAERARGEYLNIDDPVGRILSLSNLTEDDTRVFIFRAEREASRTLLALLIFEREKGILPARLSDLVADNILKSVPVDPFSGTPLLYSRERRLVWSVYMDGVDDNGRAGTTHASGPDLVWQIPKIK